MRVNTMQTPTDPRVYALKKSMQVQEQMIEKLIDSAMKQSASTNNSHLGKYIDLRA